MTHVGPQCDKTNKYDVRNGVRIVSVLLDGRLRKFGIIYSGGPGVFFFSSRSVQTSSGPTKPSTEWVLGLLLPWDEAAGVHT